MSEKNIAIFASGKGSNAQQIINHFSSPFFQDKIKVGLIVSNNPAANVLKIAQKENIPALLIEKNKFAADGYLDELKKHLIDFIVLAGFLWKIPVILIKAYPDKIINIHPALLPKHGGKGMYGEHVHQAVIDTGEKLSGITIHYVDEIYDHGRIIFQKSCAVDEHETAETLAKKIHLLEHANYPKIIEQVVCHDFIY